MVFSFAALEWLHEELLNAIYNRVAATDFQPGENTVLVFAGVIFFGWFLVV